MIVWLAILPVGVYFHGFFKVLPEAGLFPWFWSNESLNVFIKPQYNILSRPAFFSLVIHDWTVQVSRCSKLHPSGAPCRLHHLCFDCNLRGTPDGWDSPCRTAVWGLRSRRSRALQYLFGHLFPPDWQSNCYLLSHLLRRALNKHTHRPPGCCQDDSLVKFAQITR